MFIKLLYYMSSYYLISCLFLYWGQMNVKKDKCMHSSSIQKTKDLWDSQCFPQTHSRQGRIILIISGYTIVQDLF